MEKHAGPCHECSHCKNKLLCVTSNNFMYVRFGEGECFNFEDMNGHGLCRPRAIYEHLKDRFERGHDHTYRQSEDRMKRVNMGVAARPTRTEYEHMEMQKMKGKRKGKI